MPNDGQHKDVDLRVSEDPEEVLPQQWVGAGVDGKNVASKLRWNVNRNSATEITGMANSSRNWMTRIIQVNTGMRMNDMPLARMLSAVMMRLIDPVSEARPVICRPSTQKSMPLVGEYGSLEFGAYMNQPPSAAPPRIHERLMKIAPNTSDQMPRALSRGKATSRAPIWSGSR